VITEASESYYVILSSCSLEKAQTALVTIRSNVNVKGSLSTLQLDVTDRVSVETAAREVLRNFGKVNVLINNAGYGECLELS
jgi:NAD(P)-dependent dehydrogenase (short-subunit alcohol dehydrogenase family)